MNNKLMILGAGTFQVPLIRKAKEKGYFTIVVSIAGEYPGIYEADKFVEIDVRDKEKILEIAKQENIVGILTDQTDIAVASVAYVAEKLNLPGIGYECAMRFTNKYEMKKFANKIGIKTPKFFKASSFAEVLINIKELDFPVIIKPIDNQGSRGVYKLNSTNELKNKFEESISFSKLSQVIIEEYIPGKELVIEGFVANYNHHNLILGDRDYFQLESMFIPKQTNFPAHINKELKEKIFDINSKLIKGFNPKFGITHSEFILSKKNEIYLIETAIRGGGVFISSDLIPLSCGFEADSVLIDLAAGKIDDLYINLENRNGNHAGYLCFYLPEGTIRKIEGADEVVDLAGIYKSYLQNVKIGSQISSLKDKAMRLGPILISTSNEAEYYQTINKIKELLKIEVETPSGIKSINWN